MKYVLTTDNDVLIHISDTLDYQSNGNPLVDNGNLAIAKPLVKEIFEVEDEEIPAKAIENNAKYKYTREDGFTKNEDYVEYYSPEQRIEALEEMVNMLLLGEEEA